MGNIHQSDLSTLAAKNVPSNSIFQEIIIDPIMRLSIMMS